MYYLCCHFFFIFGEKQCNVLAYSVFSSIYTCTCILSCISIFGIALKKLFRFGPAVGSHKWRSVVL